VTCLTVPTPEIDASAGKLNLRMTEGDPINFSWLVLDAASWAGTSFTASVRDTSGILQSLTVAVTAQGSDALFVMTHAAIPTLPASRSGYAWAMLEAGGPTKFAGLLFVESLL
jgi:hypothetical protein